MAVSVDEDVPMHARSTYVSSPKRTQEIVSK